MTNRQIPFSPPDITEREIEAVAEALRSGWITTGPRTKELERKIAGYIGVPGGETKGSGGIGSISGGETNGSDTGGVPGKGIRGNAASTPNVVCLNSATAAEELNLRILGIGAGDEVVVPAYTYTATASAAIHCGARVRFADIQPDKPEMDYEAAAGLINENTKAIVPVDLGGIVCDYDEAFKIAEDKRGIYRVDSGAEAAETFGSLSKRIRTALGRIAVVSDSAHSFGACRAGVMAGNIADFSSFSFHAVKNFTTAEGGASTWRSIPGIDDAEIYKTFQLFSLHGQNKDALAKTKLGAWEYDIIAPLYKCNMTDVAAAIGLVQLERYPDLLKRRRAIIERYDAVCDELGFTHLNHYTDHSESSGHLYLMRIPGVGEEERNDFITKMAELGVSCNVHYKPLPMMSAYKKLGFDIKDFPNAYNYYKNLVSLPLHTKLSDDDVEYVCDCVKRCAGK